MAKLPNDLPCTKAEYMRQLLIGRVASPRTLDAALLFYHCEVLHEDARGYLDKLERKLTIAGHK